jgi:hypothetical protein
VSLSREPVFTALKENFICGLKDISNEPYCGVSGRHEVNGKAINTTNGAGPHNIQMFVLSADGTVLTCLQGFWNADDLVQELALAQQLNQVWLDGHLTRGQKNQMFSQMHMTHFEQHSLRTVARSHLQGFDAKYEAKHRLTNSDCIVNPQLAAQANVKGAKVPWTAFRTTDNIMHRRMAARPFVPYGHFDVAAYVDYGRPKYDKHEDSRDSRGQVVKAMAQNEPMIGNPDQMKKKNRQSMMKQTADQMDRRMMRRMLRRGIQSF